MSDANQPAGNSPVQPSGWYPGVGDPPGTQRWWDGEMWVGDPVPMPIGQSPIGAVAYPEQSEAVTALVVGILGFFLCQLLSPYAWIVGKRELEGIDAGRRDPKDRGLATAGKIIGMIGTILVLLVIVGFGLLMATTFAVSA